MRVGCVVCVSMTDTAALGCAVQSQIASAAIVVGELVNRERIDTDRHLKRFRAAIVANRLRGRLRGLRASLGVGPKGSEDQPTNHDDAR